MHSLRVHVTSPCTRRGRGTDHANGIGSPKKEKIALPIQFRIVIYRDNFLK